MVQCKAAHQTQRRLLSSPLLFNTLAAWDSMSAAVSVDGDGTVLRVVVHVEHISDPSETL